MNKRIQYLDGLRAVAILFVLLAHLAGIHSVRYVLEPYLDLGALARPGVYIFFFISGFAIYRFALDGITPEALPKFYMRRFARLLPALLAYLMTCLVLGWTGLIEYSWKNFMAPITYLTNTVLIDPTPYGGHTWSLSFEEQYYLIFPLFLLWSRLDLWKRLVASGAAILFIALPLLYPIPWIGRTGVFAVWGLLISGALAARIGVENKPLRYSGLAFTIGFVVLIWTREFNTPEFAVRVIDGLILPVIILCGMRIGLLNKLLSARPMQFIGGISYSLYLWQQLFTGPWLHDIDFSEVLLLMPLLIVISWTSKLVFEDRLKIYMYSKIDRSSFLARFGR